MTGSMSLFAPASNIKLRAGQAKVRCNCDSPVTISLLTLNNNIHNCSFSIALIQTILSLYRYCVDPRECCLCRVKLTGETPEVRSDKRKLSPDFFFQNFPPDFFFQNFPLTIFPRNDLCSMVQFREKISRN